MVITNKSIALDFNKRIRFAEKGHRRAGLPGPFLQALATLALLLLVACLFHTRYILSGQPFTIGRYFKALAGRG